MTCPDRQIHRDRKYSAYLELEGVSWDGWEVMTKGNVIALWDMNVF